MAVGSKNNSLCLYDFESRPLLARTATGRQEGPDTPPTPSGVRVCPGNIGGIEWNGPLKR